MSKIFIILNTDPNKEQYIEILKDRGYKENEDYFIIFKEKTELKINEVTIPSVEEMENVNQELRKAGDDYWLRSPSDYDNRMACMMQNGRVSEAGVGWRLGVRPALKIGNLASSNLEIGDNFDLGGYGWTIVSDDMALCNAIIETTWFNSSCDPSWRDLKRRHQEKDYEKSNLKNHIDSWIKENNIIIGKEISIIRKNTDSIKKINSRRRIYDYSGVYSEVYCGYNIIEIIPELKNAGGRIFSKYSLLNTLGLTRSKYRLWENCHNKLSDIVKNGSTEEKELIKLALFNEIELESFIMLKDHEKDDTEPKGKYCLNIPALRKQIELYGIDKCKSSRCCIHGTDSLIRAVMSDLGKGLDVSKYLLIYKHEFAFDMSEIDEIRRGLELGLDVTGYNVRGYSHEQMADIRQQLETKKYYENELNIQRRITGIKELSSLNDKTRNKIDDTMRNKISEGNRRYVLTLKMFNRIKENQPFLFGGYVWQKVHGTNIAVCISDNTRASLDSIKDLNRWFKEAMIKMSQEEIDIITGNACIELKQDTDRHAKEKISLLTQKQKNPGNPVISKVIIPSREEMENVNKELRQAENQYWLRSPGHHDIAAACVDDGNIGVYGVTLKLGVRPALKIENLESSDLNAGDKFELAGHKWTIISDGMALCDDIVGNTEFNTHDSNDYDSSTLKNYVEDWARRNNIVIGQELIVGDKQKEIPLEEQTANKEVLKETPDPAPKIPVVDTDKLIVNIDEENKKAGLTEHNAEPDVILTANQNIAIKLTDAIKLEIKKEAEGIYKDTHDGKSPIKDELQTLLVQYAALDKIIEDLGKYGDNIKNIIEDKINTGLENVLEKNIPEITDEIENALQLYSGALNKAVEAAKTQKLDDMRNDISSDIQMLVATMAQNGLVKDGLTFDHESDIKDSYTDLIENNRNTSVKQQTKNEEKLLSALTKNLPDAKVNINDDNSMLVDISYPEEKATEIYGMRIPGTEQVDMRAEIQPDEHKIKLYIKTRSDQEYRHVEPENVQSVLNKYGNIKSALIAIKGAIDYPDRPKTCSDYDHR